jgi:hypothetical protein
MFVQGHMADAGRERFILGLFRSTLVQGYKRLAVNLEQFFPLLARKVR